MESTRKIFRPMKNTLHLEVEENLDGGVQEKEKELIGQEYENNSEEEECSEFDEITMPDTNGKTTDTEQEFLPYTPDSAKEVMHIKSSKLTDCLAGRRSSESIAKFSSHSTSKLASTCRIIAPTSREHMALQRSINESKILTDYLKTSKIHSRKLRDKDASNKCSDMSSTDDRDVVSIGIKSKRSKRRFVPLKGGTTENNAVTSNSDLIARPSCSKRYTKSLDYMERDKIAKWPSEEPPVPKRTNMRSENPDFLQKNKDFLKRVKHSSETPERCLSRSSTGSRVITRSRSSSKSAGRYDNELSQYHQANDKYGLEIENCDKIAPNSMEIEIADSSLGVGVCSGQPYSASDISVNDSNKSLLNLDGKLNSDESSLEAHLRNVWQPPLKPGWDSFCWKCHRSHVNYICTKCIRSFHNTCIKINAPAIGNLWICPECVAVDNALNVNPKRFRRNECSADSLSQLLSIVLNRMRYGKGHHILQISDDGDFAIYNKYIVNPVSFSMIQEKIDKRIYRCAEELLNDTKWFLHNASILSLGRTTKTKMVAAAKSLIKICRQETAEIDTCAQCYLNANSRSDWFLDVCDQPHLLVWAKLKGFPYWPAKAMGIGQGSLVNVRFFGDHDRAFVPLKDCFLYSQQDPNSQTGRRSARELAECIKEVEMHIERIKKKVGAFQFAPFKAPYDPNEEMQQLERMMPGVHEYIRSQQSLTTNPPLKLTIGKNAGNTLSVLQNTSTQENSTVQNLESVEASGKKKHLEERDDDGPIKKHENRTKGHTPKYEVISKSTSDDSNSSKLNTVILKRKTAQGTVNSNDVKRFSATDGGELPPPKISRTEDISEQLNFVGKHQLASGINKGNTRDEEISESLLKSKTSKQEAQNGSGTGRKAFLQIPEDALVTSSGDKPEPAREKNLINRDPQILDKNMENSESQKERGSQKTNNILKCPVPFVEIKQEETFDNNTESGECVILKTASSRTEVRNEDMNLFNNNSDITMQQEFIANTATISNTISTELRTSSPLLTRIKQEVISDEEAVNLSPEHHMISIGSVQSVQRISPKSVNTNVTSVSTITSSNIENHNVNTNFTVSGQNPKTSAAYLTNSKRNSFRGVPYGPLPASAVPQIQSAQIKSAPTEVNQPQQQHQYHHHHHQQNQQHQQQQHQQQRAKKSFPQRSPNRENLRSTSIVSTTSSSIPTSASLVPLTTATAIYSSLNITSSHQGTDPKQVLNKNTMVTIPVDVATNRPEVTMDNINTTIPVPPLTAVSKIFSSASGLYSMSRTQQYPGPIIVSSTSTSAITAISTTTTPVIITTTVPATITHNLAKTLTPSSALTPVNLLISNVETISSESDMNPANNTSQQAINPLSMSAPPPLAGLSGTNLICTQICTSANLSNTNSIAKATTNTDTHLMGSFVAPIMSSSSVSNEATSRGPPPLLMARPIGPLQAEANIMEAVFVVVLCDVCNGGTGWIVVVGVVLITTAVVSIAYWIGLPFWWQKNQALTICLLVIKDFFISIIEDTLAELCQGDEVSLQAKITLLSLELERTKNQMSEDKRNYELLLNETRKNLENEKVRTLNEVRKQYELERLHAVEETKRKQWCAHCGRPQQERHQVIKTSSSTSPAIIFNNKNLITLKKDKSVRTKSVPQITGISVSNPVHGTEVLKFPPNTYIRHVTSVTSASVVNCNNNNQQPIRCNAPYSIPAHFFNVSVPTVPSNGSQKYTIVQPSKNWTISNGANSTLTNATTISASSTVTNVTQARTGPNITTAHKIQVRPRNITEIKPS
uniref:PWWP domain-containing protein n=1 Tax=Glossina brevipalpis TaxID=37001 RepID=A0A1A9X1J8_9MUSC